MAALTEMIRADIEDGIAEPIDPKIAAHWVMGMCASAMLESCVPGNRQNTNQIEETLSALATNALSRPGKKAATDV